MSEPAPLAKKPAPPKTMETISQTDKPVTRQTFVPPPLKETPTPPPNSNKALPNQIMLLQRTIGNHATQDYLQRQTPPAAGAGPAAPAPRLTDQQVRTALAHYRTNSRDYTADIIRQIQGAVGRPQTGTMDADDVQAVADFQRASVSGRHSLEPDGVAGTRTLAVMFPFGLAQQSQMDTFVAEFAAVIGTWATLTTPQARTNAIVNAVNQRLTASGLPNTALPTPVLGAATMPASTLGEFADGTWTITINPNIVSQATLTLDQQATLINTVYHEARHCEQVFNEARMLAGRQPAGTPAATIAQTIVNTMGVPNAVAQAAAANPLARGSTQHLIAQGMFEAFYGTGRANTRAVYRELSASRTALQAAQTAFNTSPTPANQRALDRARARRQRAWNAYHNLPEEHDAFWQGDRMEATYRGAVAVASAVSSAIRTIGAMFGFGGGTGGGAAPAAAGGGGAGGAAAGGAAAGGGGGAGGSHPMERDPLEDDPFAPDIPEVLEFEEQEGISHGHGEGAAAPAGVAE